MRALIVDDDPKTTKWLKQTVSRIGYSADAAKDGAEAIILASENPYDLILLDLLMPRMGGFDALTVLRKAHPQIIIIVVSCLSLEQDITKALDNGADDYVPKPFSPSELQSRIRAIMRRAKHAAVATDNASVLEIGELRLNLLAREAFYKAKLLTLTPKEFQLLEYLMRHPGQAISQHAIANHIFNMDYESSSNTVEMHIKNLRSKLEPDVKPADSVIETVRNLGYKLRSN
jgi:DNA-binding response OmpR family regulator